MHSLSGCVTARHRGNSFADTSACWWLALCAGLWAEREYGSQRSISPRCRSIGAESQAIEHWARLHRLHVNKAKMLAIAVCPKFGPEGVSIGLRQGTS